MSQIRAYFYDGKRSVRHTVTLERSGGSLRLHGDGIDVVYPLEAVKVSPQVPGTRRTIRFPDASLCELFTDIPIEQLVGNVKSSVLQRILGSWERSIPLAFLALVLTILLVASFIRFVLPAVARQVAQVVPQSSEERLGRETLAILDRVALKGSMLTAERTREVSGLFDRMKGDMPWAKGYRLEFRSGGGIGANAFALPGGTIIVTDEMVKLAGRDDELIGVFAHEAGHVRSRHALRHLLQSTGTGLLIAAVTGDITSITSLSATLPTALIDAGYSREFEYEADDAAIDYLLKTGRKPKAYADTLARLQAEHDKRSGGEGGKRSWTPMELLATHPETAKRMERALLPRPLRH